MPTYRVTAPDGRVFKLTGDSPPTEGELIRIYGTMKSKTPSAPQAEEFGTPFMRGLGGSLTMTGKGIQQKVAQLRDAMGPSGATIPEELLMKLITGGKSTEQITQEGEAARSDLARLKEEQPGAKVGSFVGDVVPGLAIPGGVVGGLLRRAGTGALAGGLQGATRFTGENESTLGNAAAGAAIGGALPVALAPVAKVVNAIRGNIAKPINLGAEQGIPTTLGEDLGSPFLQKMETLMERIPVIGTTAFRKQQYEAAEGAAKDYLGKYVAEGVEGTRGMLEQNRNIVSKMYDAIKQKTPELGVTRNAALETSDAIRELSVRIPEGWSKFADPTLIKTIKEFNVGGKVPSPIFHSFDDLWNLRKGIGDLLGQAKSKLLSGDVSKAQYSALSKVYSAINQDMDRFAASAGSPEISKALQAANEGYKQFVVKYNVMDRAMDKAMGQEGTGRMFSPQRFSSELNKILTKEKYNNLFTAAEKREMAGMANIMTTVKRAGQFMENPPTGNRLIDLALGGGAVASLTNPAAATSLGTSAGTVGITRFLTTTQAGKRFATAASSMEPGSPAMKVLVEKVMQGARSLGVNQATGGQ